MEKKSYSDMHCTCFKISLFIIAFMFFSSNEETRLKVNPITIFSFYPKDDLKIILKKQANIGIIVIAIQTLILRIIRLCLYVYLSKSQSFLTKRKLKIDIFKQLSKTNLYYWTKRTYGKFRTYLCIKRVAKNNS